MSPLIHAWLPLSLALNILNRAMGLSDLYPFVLSPPAIDKLGFVHELIHAVEPSGRAPCVARVTQAAIEISPFCLTERDFFLASVLFVIASRSDAARQTLDGCPNRAGHHYFCDLVHPMSLRRLRVDMLS